MKKILAGIALLSLVLGAVAPVWAAPTGTVGATVTAQLISVSITSDGSVAYGTLGANTTKNTALYHESTNPDGMNPADTQTATDGSNVDVALNIMSSDAEGGTKWELAAAAGSDAYKHEFKGGDAADWTQLPINHSYAVLDASPAAGSVNFDLQITTPITTSDYIQKTITVTVQVTE